MTSLITIEAKPAPIVVDPAERAVLASSGTFIRAVERVPARMVISG